MSDLDPALDAVAVLTLAVQFGPGRPGEDGDAFVRNLSILLRGHSMTQVAQLIGALGYVGQVLIERIASLEERDIEEILRTISLSMQRAVRDDE
jgi:hypothetical protein